MKLRLKPSFPYGPPDWPGTVERPPLEPRTGVNYDTAWARRPTARAIRAVILGGVLRPVVEVVASPRRNGLDRIAGLATPAIFVANHHSHLDTPLLLTSLPERFRRRVVVAAGADYFFDTRAKGAVSALAIGAIPIERLRVGRRSAKLAAGLLNDGWSLVIFPEGGRSPDGWGQEFRGGAAYLSLRCGVPVVPVHLEGTRRVLPKGATLPTPSSVHLTFGRPLRPGPDESARRFATRIEQAVATLADERATDWWSARRRAAAAAVPPLTGPPSVSAWRRAWALKEHDPNAKQRRRNWPS